MKRVARTWAARLCATAIVLSFAAIAQAAHPKRWILIPLGGTYAATVNNRGDIGGHARVNMPPGSFPPFANHAVVWERGEMRDVGATFGTPPGAGFSEVDGVNDRGTFVLATPDGVATLKNGTLTQLGFAAAPRSINNSGAIVGSMSVGGGTVPFLYRDGVLHDLGTLGGNSGIAIAINERGTIVGQSSLATGFNFRPFVYKDGVMKDLGTFGGDIGYARDVNNRDVVVGDSRDSTGRFLAFMTDGSGVLRPFLDLPGDQTAVAINQRGIPGLIIQSK